MTDAEQQQQIAADVADIKALLTTQNGRLTVLEEWRVTHQELSDTHKADMNQRMEQQNVEVLRRVLRDMQVLVKDAMRSGMQELFTVLYSEEKAKDRKERRDDMRDALHSTEFAIKYVYSALQLIVVVAVVYALVWK